MRAIRSLYRRLDVTIAMHAPFVWRTRALLWIAAGLLITLAARVIAGRVDLRPEALPTLASTSWWLSAAQFLLFAAFFLVVADVRRRTRAVVVLQHRLRVVACMVVVALVLLILPVHAFVSVLAPRLAAIEWRPSPGSLDGQLSHIEAARGYLRDGWSGEYGVIALFWMVPGATIGAVLALIGSRRPSTVRRLLRALRFSRRWPSAFRWKARLEIVLASRFPTLFSARLHASPGSLLMLPAALALTAAGRYPELSALAALATLPGVYFTLRGQETVRHQLMPGAEDVRILGLHALWFFAFLAAGLNIFPGWSAVTMDTATIVVWLSLVICATMQAARATSALVAFGGMFGAFVVMYAMVLALESLGVGSGDTQLLSAFAVVAVVPFVTLRGLARRSMAPGIQKVMLTMFLVMAPPVGLACVLVAFAPTPASMSHWTLIGTAISGVLVLALALRLTTDTRRVLATTR